MLNISNIVTKGSIVIDGREFDGKELELKPYIDGKPVEGGTLSGNIKIEIHGDCGNIKTMSGDVIVDGSSKDIQTMSGDVTVKGSPLGKVKTMSGDITIK